MRLLGLFCGTTGCYLDGEICPYSGKGHAETSLMIKLLDRVEKNSILVLDRFFTSLHLQDLFKSKGIDYVIRSRDKFAKKYLGNKKDIIIDHKMKTPKKNSIYSKSKSSDIKVRLIKSSLERKGFRPVDLFIITSLLKASKKDIEAVYLERWDVEVDLRNFKETLKSSKLLSKSPDMSEKELWIRLLSYNLVRSLTVTSCGLSGTIPRKVSFKLCLNVLVELFRGLKNIGLLNEVSRIKLKSKYRREPRAVKKRQNRYPNLTTTRKKSIEQDWGYSRRRPQKGARVVHGALNASS